MPEVSDVWVVARAGSGNVERSADPGPKRGVLISTRAAIASPGCGESVEASRFTVAVITRGEQNAASIMRVLTRSRASASRG